MNLCEAGRVDYSHHSPVIIKCGEPANQGLVCDECYESIKESIERMQSYAKKKKLITGSRPMSPRGRTVDIEELS